MSESSTESTLSSSATPLFRIKFYRGALNGQTREYPVEMTRVTLYGYTYEATGRRDGDFWVYVPVPKTKKLKKFLQFLMQVTGRDPRLADINTPVKATRRGRNSLCYCGSGKKYKKCHGGIG